MVQVILDLSPCLESLTYTCCALRGVFSFLGIAFPSSILATFISSEYIYSCFFSNISSSSIFDGVYDSSRMDTQFWTLVNVLNSMSQLSHFDKAS